MEITDIIELDKGDYYAQIIKMENLNVQELIKLRTELMRVRDLVGEVIILSPQASVEMGMTDHHIAEILQGKHPRSLYIPRVILWCHQYLGSDGLEDYVPNHS